MAKASKGKDNEDMKLIQQFLGDSAFDEGRDGKVMSIPDSSFLQYFELLTK